MTERAYDNPPGVQIGSADSPSSAQAPYVEPPRAAPNNIKELKSVAETFTEQARDRGINPHLYQLFRDVKRALNCCADTRREVPQDTIDQLRRELERIEDRINPDPAEETFTNFIHDAVIAMSGEQYSASHGVPPEQINSLKQDMETMKERLRSFFSDIKSAKETLIKAVESENSLDDKEGNILLVLEELNSLKEAFEFDIDEGAERVEAWKIKRKLKEAIECNSMQKVEEVYQMLKGEDPYDKTLNDEPTIFQ